MAIPGFKKHVVGELINDVGPSQMNTLFMVGDINCSGLVDLVVSGRNGEVAWFENPGQNQDDWKKHRIAVVKGIECGGLVYDLTGSGYPDVILPGDSSSDELAWWENPGPEGGQWIRRIIAKTSQTQFHNTLIADITGDGRMSLVFWNQGGNALYQVPLPNDPKLSPWPGLKVIDCGIREEGLAAADIDGDGKNELISGTHWYKYRGMTGSEWGRTGEWEVHAFAEDYISTKVAVGDINGDGQNEIILSEGDACIYGKPQGGKLAWFEPGDDVRDQWREHIIDDLLKDPHSLDLGDVSANGSLDILVGEIGIGDRYEEIQPRVMLYENDGQGSFKRHTVDEGTGTHEARLIDLNHNGRLDICGKPIHGPEKWKVHVWYNTG